MYLACEMFDEQIMASTSPRTSLLAGILTFPSVLLSIVGKDQHHARWKASLEEGRQGDMDQVGHSFQDGLLTE